MQLTITKTVPRRSSRFHRGLAIAGLAVVLSALLGFQSLGGAQKEASESRTAMLAGTDRLASDSASHIRYYIVGSSSQAAEVTRRLHERAGEFAGGDGWQSSTVPYAQERVLVVDSPEEETLLSIMNSELVAHTTVTGFTGVEVIDLR